jgi:hypothetical protein
MVEALVAMVEAELALFEVEEEGVRVGAAESRQAALGVAPEALDAIDVIAGHASAGELVAGMIDTQMLLVSKIDKPVVAAPAVGADDAVQGDFATNRRGKHGFRAVGHDLGVDLAVPLEDAEDRRLASRAPPGLALDAAWPEVTLIDLDDAGELALRRTALRHAHAQTREQTVDGVAVQAGELGDLNGGQVCRHMAQKLAENHLRDSSADDIAVLHGNHSLSGPSRQAQLVMTHT